MDSFFKELKYVVNTRYDGRITWAIPDFSKHFKKAVDSSKPLELVSKPFFTSRNGYKFVVVVYLNGQTREVEGKFMSAYLSLVWGDTDDVLEWPFPQTKAGIFLLDPSKSTNNYKMHGRTFTMPATERPKPDVVRAWECYGQLSFIDIDTLRNKYVHDDTLHVHAYVDIRNIKPF